MAESYLDTAFPHTCSCGLSRDREAWLQLDLVGVGHIPADAYGPAESLEYRNCTCGSTVAVPIVVQTAHARLA